MKRKYILSLLVLLFLSACTENGNEKAVKKEIKHERVVKRKNSKVKEKYIPKEYDIFSSETWMTHLKEDLMPFWEMKDAVGEPLGKFMTYRMNNGEVYSKNGLSDIDVYPRMMGRQIYAYSMAYFLTGDKKYLLYAKKGTEYLVKYGRDPKDKAWYTLVKDEKAVPMRKNSQNDSYSVMGPASYYFITRDNKYRDIIMENSDNIFDENKYWNVEKQRVRAEMKKTKRYNTDLTSHLDQINAYMLMAQGIMPEKTDRDKLLTDMRKLADVMLRDFMVDKYFSRVASNQEGMIPAIDFGHTIKSYWILNILDGRLKEKRYQNIMNNVSEILDEAYDEKMEMWHDSIDWRETGNKTSYWWAYAELSQASELYNVDGRYDERLKKVENTWLNYFVDHSDKEVYSALTGEGKTPDEGMYSKQNEWKNGFHSIEHAMFNYIFARMREGKTFDCYFAVPKEFEGDFITKPYIFKGDEVKRERLEEIDVDGEEFIKLKVSFENIRGF